MQLQNAIESRKSVRKFSSKKPDWRDIIECIDSARYAPMAGNNFSLKFIMVEDKDTIQKLAEASQQDFVGTAQYVVVVCSTEDRTINAYEKFGETFLRQQAGSAIENFLLSIVDKGLSTCWIGYFVEEQIKSALKIPEKIKVEALFPIGYEHPMEKIKKRRKVELDNILYFDKYGNKKMRKISKHD